VETFYIFHPTFRC